MIVLTLLVRMLLLMGDTLRGNLGMFLVSKYRAGIESRLCQFIGTSEQISAYAMTLRYSYVQFLIL